MRMQRNRDERIIVALDYSERTEAEQLLDQLYGIPCYFKVGMQLFYAEGPDYVRSLKARGHRVFLDLKLHDIPNTVRGAAQSLTRLGVDMFNVHAAGGQAMLEAALLGVRDALEKDASLTAPCVIGVTQLTSTSEQVLNDEIGIPGRMEETVLRYAAMCSQSGLGGIVCSPREARLVKAHCGEDFLSVTPGIRPAGASVDDQSRIMTPAQAFAAGSDYIVIGRPITAAPNPRQALEEIILSVQS